MHLSLTHMPFEKWFFLRHLFPLFFCKLRKLPYCFYKKIVNLFFFICGNIIRTVIEEHRDTETLLQDSTATSNHISHHGIEKSILQAFFLSWPHLQENETHNLHSLLEPSYYQQCPGRVTWHLGRNPPAQSAGLLPPLSKDTTNKSAALLSVWMRTLTLASSQQYSQPSHKGKACLCSAVHSCTISPSCLPSGRAGSVCLKTGFLCHWRVHGEWKTSAWPGRHGTGVAGL